MIGKIIVFGVLIFVVISAFKTMKSAIFSDTKGDTDDVVDMEQDHDGTYKTKDKK